MREIKFRGKRIDNGEWVIGCLIIENPPLQCFASENKEPNKYLIGKSGFADWNMPRPFTAAEVITESIGQYTGLKDKNGKEIYEGDIVSVPYVTPLGELTDEEDYRAIVVFKNGSFQIKSYNNVTYDLLSIWCEKEEGKYIPNVGTVFQCKETTLLIVFGNIHEHPELINQQAI